MIGSIVAGALISAAPVVQAKAADLKVALSTNLNSLDPTTTTFGEDYVFSGLVFSALVGADADGKSLRSVPQFR